MSFEVLNPTHEETAIETVLAERLESVDGAIVGVISNGKQGTRPFFDALARELRARGAAEVELLTKSNYSAPADAEILDRARRWTALVAGVGD